MKVSILIVLIYSIFLKSSEQEINYQLKANEMTLIDKLGDLLKNGKLDQIGYSLQ